VQVSSTVRNEPWDPERVSGVAPATVANGVARPKAGKFKRATVPVTPLARGRRARKLTAQLAVEFPAAGCELDFTTPLELAVATILSAQSTDVRVNMVTPALFARYLTAADYAGADRSELEAMVRTTGFFRNKANSIIGLGQALVERYDGVLPNTLTDLVTLPGFGRKTANVVLGHAFTVPGITVDTHVGRLVRRWGLTTQTDPVRVELELNLLVPTAEWTTFSDRTIYHGRRVCHAKKPACGACYLKDLCPSFGAGPVELQLAEQLIVGAERPHLLAIVGLAEPG